MNHSGINNASSTLPLTIPSIHRRECNLGIHTFSCVIDAKVSSSVDDDALDRDIEALVQTLQTIRPGDLHQAVSQTSELPLCTSLAHVSCQAGSGEVEWVHETQGGGTSRPTGGQVAGEVPPELGALVYTIQKDLLVLILEGKVEGLGGEVPDDIGQVPSPEGQEPLLLGDADHTVHNALVMLICCDLLAGMLYLYAQRKIKGLLRIGHAWRRIEPCEEPSCQSKRNRQMKDRR